MGELLTLLNLKSTIQRTMKIIKAPTIVMSACLLLLSSPVSATITNPTTLDFDQGDYYKNSSIDTPNIQMPSGVFAAGNNGEWYQEEGIRHFALPFNGGFGSHIHGNNYTDLRNNDNRMSTLNEDAGGGMFDLADGSSFSFKSWDSVFFNHDITVTGFDTNGNSFSVNLDIATYAGFLTPVDFLSLNPAFGNVNKVEYWYTETGRGEPGPETPNFGITQASIDNVVFAAPVPIPAAFYLFASGLFGLISRRYISKTS